MINITLFIIVAFIYLIASVLYLFYFLFNSKKTGRLATGTTIAGLVVQTGAYIVRWVETAKMGYDHTPLSFFTLYETLIFIGWSLVIAYLVVEYLYRFRHLGVFIMPLITLIMFAASFAPGISSQIEELPSVLQGNLFPHHVISSTGSYAAFLVSVIASIFILISGRNKQSRFIGNLLERLPNSKMLDGLSYKAIAVGFILFTIGMATGAYRAKVIWGSYWSWDPVETSALVTWLLYALIMHGRYQKWWGMRTTSMLSITAFCISVLCFMIAGSYMMTSGHYPVK